MIDRSDSDFQIMTGPDDTTPLLDLPLPALLSRAAQVREVPGAALRVAVLGGVTTQFLVRLLPVFLAETGLRAQVYEAPYGSLVESILNPASELYAFAPNITILLPGPRDAGTRPALLASREAGEQLVEEEAHRFRAYWDVLLKGMQTHVIQANFALPAERALGNLEASVPYGELAFVRALNSALVRKLRPSVTLLDLEYLVSSFGIARAFERRTYYLTKQFFSFEFLPTLAHGLAAQIALQAGRARKCAVLDLDGTLWGGTIGDDDLEGIVLGPDSPEGEAFADFQRYLRKLKQRGVLLAVCSKNDEAVARDAFERHPHMQLTVDDIACFVANWEDKASNVTAIARQLNIGLDALVFIDNSAEERHIVRSALPDVYVVELPDDASDYIASIDRLGLFELSELSAEATHRTESFAHDKMRAEVERNVVDYDAYLRSLELTAEVSKIGAMNLPRVSELVKRSNQFNLRTQRHGEQQILDLAEDPKNVAFCVGIGDRFGHHGVVSVLLAEKRGDDLFIDTWLMSCRVLKRGVETLVLEHLVKEARERGVGRLLGEYLPTAKNNLVQDLLPSLGFTLLERNAERSLYELRLSDDLPRVPHFIAQKGTSES